MVEGTIKRMGRKFVLNEKRIKQENYFNPEQIRNKWKEHLSEKKIGNMIYGIY